jgi:GST-like protein
MFGQLNHFRNYAPEKLPYAITSYSNEAHRLYRVLNTRLTGRDYVAGDYSIADMAIFGWARNWESRGLAVTEFPNVVAWHDRIAARPAVQRGLALTAPTPPKDLATDLEAQKVLFGQR